MVDDDALTRSFPKATTALGLPIALSIGWGGLMSAFGEGSVYTVMGPYAALVVLVCFLVERSRGSSLADLGVDKLAWGLGIGVVTTLSTYVVYDAASRMFPWLEPRVRDLYREAGRGSWAAQWGAVIVIIVAEEMLFRGLAIRRFARVTSRRGAAVVSVLLYALAQGGAGSWVIVAMALVMGGIWTLMRLYFASIWPSLVAHLIWTPIVIVLRPVV